MNASEPGVLLTLRVCSAEDVLHLFGDVDPSHSIRLSEM